MSLKQLVNNSDIWNAFLEELDEIDKRVFIGMKKSDGDAYRQWQGKGQLVDELRKLKDKVNKNG